MPLKSLVLLCLLSGCGKPEWPKDTSAPPFVLNDLFFGDLPQKPSCIILAPSHSLKIGPRGKVDCRFKLEVPDRKLLPTAILVSLSSDKNRMSGNEVVGVPSAIDGQSYVFQATLRAGKANGKFALTIKLIYSRGRKDPKSGQIMSIGGRIDEIRGPQITVESLK